MKKYHVILERYNGRRGFMFEDRVEVGDRIYHQGKSWLVYKVEEMTI